VARSSHNRQEIREGMQRPISKTYYYINFRQTIDAIKYRIYRLTKEVESMIRPTEERKDYYCPRCKSRWTQMEVLDNPGINGFNCHRCGESLERDDESAGDRGGHEIQRKLMQQLDPLLNLLPEIDKVVIPE
jgi:transcription initiation factor TFIIE subunit alpha